MVTSRRMEQINGLSFNGRTLTWPTHIREASIALGWAGIRTSIYPGIWEEVVCSQMSDRTCLVATIKRPASVRNMISAVKQSGTIQAVLGVEEAFLAFGFDLGQRLGYVLPTGFKISLDPTWQTIVWPARPGSNHKSRTADHQALSGWLAAYSPGYRIFSLRYNQVSASGIRALAALYGTGEVQQHIDAALNQFGIGQGQPLPV